MNFLKYTARLLLVLSLVILGAKTSFASDIQDVPEGYWAQDAITDCVNRGYFKLDASGNF